MSTQTRVLLPYAGVVALLLGSALFGMFLGDGVGWASAALFFTALPLTGVAVAGQALWRPTWRKVAVAAAALGLGYLALDAGMVYAARAGERLFFRSRRAALDAFTRDALAYPPIRDMSDGQRYFKTLNGALVAYEPAAVDTGHGHEPHPVLPLARVLARDDVDPHRYEAFRRRLIALKLIEYEIAPGAVAFLYDGMLNRGHGFLYVRPGAAVPALATPWTPRRRCTPRATRATRYTTSGSPARPTRTWRPRAGRRAGCS